mgnify:FL=1
MDQYFSDSELKCKCCGDLRFDAAFRVKLNVARHLAGIPFVVSSGYRCPANNEAEGSKTQNHPKGLAIDIKCTDLLRRYKIVKALIEVGILGIGIYPTFIHGDINRGRPRIWLG